MNPLVVTASHVAPDSSTRTTTARSWLVTTDSRRLSLLYLIAVTCFTVVAFAAQGVLRLELTTPAGDLISAFAFGRLSSLHTLLITFFFALPAIPVVFGNLLLPRLVGARGLAFPRLALLSWYLYAAGGLLLLGAALTGNIEAGWAYAVTTAQSAVSASAVSMIGIFLACAALLLNGLNFLVTLAKLRSPGCRWSDQSLFVWSLFASGLIMALALPFFAMTVILGLLEHLFSLGMFDPAHGGDPTLLPQLAAYFTAPATWLVLLPAMGIISEIISAAAHRPVPERKVVAGCFLALAVLSFLALGSGMQTGGVPGRFSMIFALFGFVSLVPFALVVGHWLRTLYHGSISINASLIYAIGFVFMTTAGVLCGLFLSPLGLGSFLRGTVFAVAHFHYLVIGGALLAFLAALHHWWPALTGREAPQIVARATAVAVIAGLQFTYLPLFLLGPLGLPAGHYTYPPEFQLHQVLSSAGGTILTAGLVCTLAYFLWTLGQPAQAAADAAAESIEGHGG